MAKNPLPEPTIAHDPAARRTELLDGHRNVVAHLTGDDPVVRGRLAFMTRDAASRERFSAVLETLPSADDLRAAHVEFLKPAKKAKKSRRAPKLETKPAAD